ncbi:riboflavin synthase [Gammaproteobacteria bacterium LSUCC0057]|jgi:riboflavin synthase|uniref:Riboflavin synthase n=1 Tax=Gammaproteobacteria bacterium LSUCC0057 TaxID=2559237 RepID=A0A4Y8UJC5_9GAMM|nr:riboflavin synthase [Gammaproteobacteria bacterium LSUCC0057]
MFTGIIAALGEITELQPRDGDLRLTIDAGALPMADVKLGDSIACNGCCLTVVELRGQQFAVDVSVESLDLTTIGRWQLGSRINLEKAMQAGDRFGGHMVSGHVDGLGEVVSRHSDARSERFRLRAPAALARYIAPKGSITIDGTSLTVNVVEGSEFEICIIPHTLDNTIIGGYQPGTAVNLEVDLVARYLERLLAERG